jgi:putative ABC transport system permease protein
MSLLEAFRIAIKELFANKMRSLLTMLGVIIGVASVITLVSIGEGVRWQISRQIEALGSNLVIVTPGKGTGGVSGPTFTGAVSKLRYDDALAIEKRAGSVKNTAPLIESGGVISLSREANSKKVSTVVSGTSESYPEVRNQPLRAGDFISRTDIRGYRQVAVLGDTVRRKLFGDKTGIGEEIHISGEHFKIIGVMRKKGRTLTIDNDDRVFVPITVAEELLKTQQVSIIFVQSVNPQEVDDAVSQTRRVLNLRHQKSDFAVSEQKDILSTFKGIMNTLTAMLGGIAGVSLLVGGIGIMNIMMVSVTERTREIGIRKAVGAKNKDVMLQFLLESIVISSFGGALGIGLGFIGSRFLDGLMPNLKTMVSPWSILIAFAFSLLVGLFFGIYPARKAARLNPIDALRYE